MDEVARGRLETDGAARDDQVPESISGWREPQEPTRMKVGCSVIANISATTISTLSVPIPVEITEIRRPRHGP